MHFYRDGESLGNSVEDGTGKIWLANIGCTGTEETLVDCYHSGWGVKYCTHGQDVGIECSKLSEGQK